jgi:hypothetical protein
MGSLLDLALPCRSSATLAKSGDPPRRASEGLPPGRARKGRSKGQGLMVGRREPSSPKFQSQTGGQPTW